MNKRTEGRTVRKPKAREPQGIVGYKLTDRDGYTRKGQTGETLWRVGETVRPTGVGSSECGPGVLHDYPSALLAVLLNPIHADIAEPRLFEVRHESEPQTDGLKRWTTGALRVVRELELPVVTTAQRVRWAILVSLESEQSRAYRDWARRWLSGEDRTWAAARAAAAAASAAAWAATWAAAAWAAKAAREAARAAARAAAKAARAAAASAAETAASKPALSRKLHRLALQAIREERG